MSNILLIHGAWGGAWEFQETIDGLRNRGHRASAIDLPGHGQQSTPISEVTMEAYVQRVINAAEAIEGPIVLVGHSLGGAIISQVAERIARKSVLLHDVREPERLAAFLPHFAMKQATEPFMFAADLTEEAFGSVPKYYVRASLDKVLSPVLQDRMLTGWNVEQVFTLESGHFPLMSVPGRLIEVISDAAGASMAPAARA